MCAASSSVDDSSTSIDLSGGYYIVLTPKNADKSNQSVIEQAQTILSTRLNSNGCTGSVITVLDAGKIKIEIPKINNGEEVLETIGSTGFVTFQDYKGFVFMDGRDTIDSAHATKVDDGSYVIVLNFTERGVAAFSQATNDISQHTGGNNVLKIFLDLQEIFSPTISKQITNTSFQIEGNFTYTQAKALASVIDSGSLPINYEISEQGIIDLEPKNSKN